MTIIRSKQRLKRFLLLAISLLVPCFIWAFRNMKANNFTTNIAQTTADNTDKNLRTRFYHAAVEDVTQNIQAIAPTLCTYGRRWKWTGAQQQNVTTTIHCAVPVLVFTDDLTISLRQQNNLTQVDVRSQSRIGRGDFGENQRHIAQLLQKLDEKLS